jgi:hypothetical protein
LHSKDYTGNILPKLQQETPVHFRIRKNIIQLIRITYDDAKKKGINTIVGSVPVITPVLSDSLQASLTAEELLAFEQWVCTRHRAIMLSEEIAALSLAENMLTAEQWFGRDTEDTMAMKVLAKDLMVRWQSLRRVLIKKGLLE